MGNEDLTLNNFTVTGLVYNFGNSEEILRKQIELKKLEIELAKLELELAQLNKQVYPFQPSYPMPNYPSYILTCENDSSRCDLSDIASSTISGTVNENIINTIKATNDPMWGIRELANAVHTHK